MSQCTKSEMLSLQVLLLEAVQICVIVVLPCDEYDVPVYQVSLSEQASYSQILLHGAVVYKLALTFRVVLCTSVPSLIVSYRHKHKYV